MKVVRQNNGKDNAVTYYAVTADGLRLPSNGYPKTTPAAARREGEKVIAMWAVQEAARKTGKYSPYEILSMGREYLLSEQLK